MLYSDIQKCLRRAKQIAKRYGSFDSEIDVKSLGSGVFFIIYVNGYSETGILRIKFTVAYNDDMSSSISHIILSEPV